MRHHSKPVAASQPPKILKANLKMANKTQIDVVKKQASLKPAAGLKRSASKAMKVKGKKWRKDDEWTQFNESVKVSNELRYDPVKRQTEGR